MPFYIFQFSIMSMYCFSSQRKNKYHLFHQKKKTKTFKKSKAGLSWNSMCWAHLCVFGTLPTDHTPSSSLSSSFCHSPGSLSDWGKLDLEQRDYFPCVLTSPCWPDLPAGLVLPLILHQISRELQTWHVYSQIIKSFPVTFVRKNLSLQ